ncbi:ATP-binding protein [Thiohalobacter sp. IOR34]|uniref:ATP-binding protein n=1 Tax=Thiohalobacter sp. IOR34 TaxID=3057176 RepID=UPI0025B27136|nr:ATP-binding protein [Thiohalobacter sp. IOR34]WJW75404.1 ATP-binding protein [Thiohalobacter sp. IOR34]
MLSLRARLLLAALLVLVTFMGLTGLALDRAFRTSAEQAVRSRLQASLYGLLGVLDLDEQGRLLVPRTLPEPRFEQPDSGLYAQLTAPDGRVLWRSHSALERRFPVSAVPPGERRFQRVPAPGGGLFRLDLGLVWDYAPGAARRLTVSVAESAEAYEQEVAAFRRSLWLWLGAAGALLLLVQLGVLGWGLAPLRAVAAGVARVQAGRQERLGGRYPRELQALTDNLDALIAANRRQLARYRDALADLAHSLKTPLAVLRGAAREHAGSPLAAVVEEQSARMGQIVDYQLQRAATAGQGALRPPLRLRPVLERLCASLDKVHADRGLRCELEVAAELQCALDEGDLFELAGNLLENAYKWARGRIRLQAGLEDGRLRLVVEDDGPGIPETEVEAVLARGRRADQSVPGHGIGLAVVKDIVEAYQGRLEIGRSELGGARLELELEVG